MSRATVVIIAVCLILLPNLQGSSSDDKTPDAVKKILRNYTRASTIEKASGYLKEAKEAGATAEALTGAAKSRYKRHLEALKQSYNSLEVPVKPFLTMTPESGFMKELKEWNTSAQDTLAYIFDDANYAVPAKAQTGWTPGKDIQPNQAIVEAKVEDTIELWNHMINQFGKHAHLRIKSQRNPGGGGYSRKVKSSKPEDMRMVQIPILQYNLADPASSLDTLAKKAGKGYPTFKEAMAGFQSEIKLANSAGYKPDKLKLKALPIAVGALYSDNISDAMTKYRPSQGTDEGRLFALYTALYLYRKSLDQPDFMSKAAHDAMQTNNLYRLALGLMPMLPNEKLQRAADGHSIYQKKHGMGHSETDDDMRSPKLRAQKAGYRGGVTENCYSGGIADAVWTWRTDAGHHRNLIQPKAKVAGISDKGLPTKNCGFVCEDAKMAPLFQVTY